MASSLQPQLLHFSLCNCSSILLPPNSHLPSHASPFPCHKRPLSMRLCSSRHETPNNTIKFGGSSNNRPGFSSPGLDRRNSQRNSVKTSGSARVKESVEKGAKSDGNSTTRVDSANRRRTRSSLSSKREKDGNSDASSLGMSNSQVDNGKMAGKSGAKGKNTKRSKKTKENPADTKLRVKLEMCSKAGDVMGAIAVYDSAVSEGIELGQYLYTVLLYLCSSAAMGVVRPAKSGSGTRSIDMFALSGTGEENLDREGKSEMHSSDGETEDGEKWDEEEDEEENDGDVQIGRPKRAEIHVSESEKKYALQRGFEIYERMCSESIPMNEATLTSVARMALAMGDGDKAFQTVKQMKELGINPKLRSYGPALSMFCSKGDVEKAFEVEKHMLEHGVQPEEPELEALLRVCINAGKSDKIYYLMHKLRAAVRSVSPPTADLIEKWFVSKEASRVGKRRWDPKMIVQIMESVGGGWHGQGWLGTGKWSISHTLIDSDGLCKCCGEKLALIDLDPEETERFAESVAAIASKREKNSSFEKFQRWLDYYGPFEAVVDAANIGLFSQRKFKLSKVRAVVSGIRQMLTSKKWPLVVLHNRRVTGSNMNEPVNRAIIERWKNADALYATPTGSNDDWYWLYAAIKFRCFLVTNDEMRDHIFQLLGNDFFPRWKERHQVRFSFSEVGPLFHMPPPCSVVIQENERGQWHIPIASKHQSVGEITWLCIRRVKPPRVATQDPLSTVKASPQFEGDKTEEHVDANCKAKGETEDERRSVAKQDQETYRRKISISAGSFYSGSLSILSEIQSAEEKSGNAIDFQI